MSNWQNRLKSWAQNDWAVSFFILLAFLAIKGYKYGWDDQHLEIPLLKGLIDSALYQGDYYVESLKANFPGYFYSLLARCITVKQIPAAYFILYLISKYFLFFFAYKLWCFIAKRKSVAFIYMAVFMMFGRVPEFLYRTFSHQEFTIAIAIAGLYFFYTERFVLAAVILGIGSNFHLIYALFPMIYLVSYLLLHIKRHGFKILAKTVAGFLLFASPIIISIIQKRLITHWGNPTDSFVDWVTLYKLGCPQNFIFYGVTLKYALTKFAAWFSVVQEYIFLIALFVLNICFNEKFKKDGKAHAISLAALSLFILSYIFTYFIPTRLVLDMNLVRNVQFLFFILLGYTTLLVVSTIDEEKAPIGYAATILFSCLALNNRIGLLAIGAFIFLLAPKLIGKLRVPPIKLLLKFLSYAGLCVCLFFIAKLTWDSEKLAKMIILAMTASTTGVYIFTLFKKQPYNFFLIKRLFVLLPLVVILTYHIHSHVTHVTAETKGGGFWKLQRDWEDMQHFVRNNTSKSATFLVPNDMEMGGFRIYSERPIVCCYRDCGIVGFDYQAAVEWLKRLHDIESFKVILNANGDIKPAIMTAVLKYKVDYIVFMRYYAPSSNITNLYDKIYENDSFSLFKVPFNSR